jgi:hypothetical protein
MLPVHIPLVALFFPAVAMCLLQPFEGVSNDAQAFPNQVLVLSGQKGSLLELLIDVGNVPVFPSDRDLRKILSQLFECFAEVVRNDVEFRARESRRRERAC